MSAVEVEKKVKDGREEKLEKGGELLFCGRTIGYIIGRRKDSVDGNLASPTRLGPLSESEIQQNKISNVKQTTKKNAKTSDHSRKKKSQKIEDFSLDIDSSWEEDNGEVEPKRQMGKRDSRGRGSASGCSQPAKTITQSSTVKTQKL